MLLQKAVQISDAKSRAKAKPRSLQSTRKFATRLAELPSFMGQSAVLKTCRAMSQVPCGQSCPSTLVLASRLPRFPIPSRQATTLPWRVLRVQDPGKGALPPPSEAEAEA